MIKTSLLASSLATSLAASLALVGCAQSDSGNPDDYKVKGSSTKSDSSVEAVFVEFEFDGELLANSSFNPRRAIDDQLLYTIGHLNGTDSNGVGRLDKVRISDINTESVNGMTRITYHAVLPAAWGHPNDIPSTHTFRLPRNVSFSGQEAFTDKYKGNCVDRFAHDVDAGIMWYYYRPNSFGCDIDAEDIVELTADVTLSPTNTTGMYPEYDKIWEDDVLNIVAIFGKAEEDATSNSDAGISAFNAFNRAIKNELSGLSVTTEPATVPFSPGNDMPDVTYTATLPGGKTIVVTALLIDGVRVAPLSFDNRYEALTRTADLIAYMGHSGLGANIRALARKGDWRTGQYSMIYMGGCDTYAYVDSALADAHSAVNADDPNGTKYMDIVTNAQPAFFHENPNTMMQFVRGLMAHDNPKTFEQMFAKVDDFQVILVSGEEDNTFVPGGGGGDVVVNWGGMDAAGTVLRNAEDRFEIAEGKDLEAGTYVFELTGNSDADLYVRIGSAPTTIDYDCRPFLGGSFETCVVDLASPAPVHVMVRGWRTSSDYELSGHKQ